MQGRYRGRLPTILVGLNLRGEVVVRKKLSREQLLHFTGNRQIDLIGMEACGGAHSLRQALQEYFRVRRRTCDVRRAIFA